MTENSNCDEKTILELFDDGFTLFQNCQTCSEATNSVSVQNKVKQAMHILEDVTKLTSMAGVFSTNESIDEIATENLRLFLLPALLGTLALQLTGTHRMEVVETSDVYFRDFIQRCNDYSITEVEIEPPAVLDPVELEKSYSRPTWDVAAAAKTRANKIQKYRENKALEKELEDLEILIKNENIDESTKRIYYLKLIKSYVNKAVDDLDCLLSERRLLTHMKNIAKNEDEQNKDESSRKKSKYYNKPKPLKPVIITKDEVQKAVFGAGYPSLPTMTVQEFYESRVREGIFPTASEVAARSLQDASKMDEEVIATEQEKENAKKEELIEQDDEEQLQRARDMDEFKDVNKRSWGNRYNRS